MSLSSTFACDNCAWCRIFINVAILDLFSMWENHVDYLSWDFYYGILHGILFCLTSFKLELVFPDWKCIVQLMSVHLEIYFVYNPVALQSSGWVHPLGGELQMPPPPRWWTPLSRAEALHSQRFAGLSYIPRYEPLEKRCARGRLNVRTRQFNSAWSTMNECSRRAAINIDWGLL